ncbi:MAG: aminoglycoside phosphotransferase [Acidimicrobiales bacterium]
MQRSRSTATLDDLLAGATDRRPWVPDDTKSGARFERLVIDGERYVLKYQDARDDWLMRASGDDGGRYTRLWQHGLLDALPPVVDHAVVAAGLEAGVGRVLLRDVSAELLVPGAAFTMAQHQRFVDHMAAVHAAFWGWRDDVGLTPLDRRYLIFSPDVARYEEAIASPAIVPRFMAAGWARLRRESRALGGVVFSLLADQAPLLSALATVPHTLVHGDWKAANLGSHADGRTVLLDFGEAPGEASPLADLAWYLALNADLLPESKDATIERFRAALEGHRVATSPWWERAVALEMLGAMLQFGWEKGLGGAGPELDWWASAALAGARQL